MAEHRTCILEDHGDLLGELSLHTHTWMPALDMLGGITGARLKMKEVLAFTSTGTPFYGFAKCLNFSM